MTWDDRDLHKREVDLARDLANKAGPAMAFADVSTSGPGSFAFDKRVDFGLTFVVKPTPAYCAEVDYEDAEELFGTTLPNPLPQTSGFVTDWDLSDAGHYIGCWVAVSVLYSDIAIVDSLTVRHHFTFSAVALKDLADSEQEEA